MWDQIDFRAKVFVHGLRPSGMPAGHPLHGKHSLDQAKWSTRFAGHPWAIESDRVGWGRELRIHLVRVVRSRMAAGQSCEPIEELMPPLDLVEYWRHRAEIYRLAAEQREAKEHLPPTRARRSTMRPLSDAATAELSNVSRRITGEADR